MSPTGWYLTSPVGWYLDPNDHGFELYWDGHRWLWRRPYVRNRSEMPYGWESVIRTFTRAWLGLSRWAQIAIIFGIVAFGIGAVVVSVQNYRNTEECRAWASTYSGTEHEAMLNYCLDKRTIRKH